MAVLRRTKDKLRSGADHRTIVGSSAYKLLSNHYPTISFRFIHCFRKPLFYVIFEVKMPWWVKLPGCRVPMLVTSEDADCPGLALDTKCGRNRRNYFFFFKEAFDTFGFFPSEDEV